MTTQGNIPAFPRRANSTEGMSLRDWFAGQALAGLASTDWFHSGTPIPQILAENAYAIADEMLKQRQKQTTP